MEHSALGGNSKPVHNTQNPLHELLRPRPDRASDADVPCSSSTNETSASRPWTTRNWCIERERSRRDEVVDSFGMENQSLSAGRGAWLWILIRSGGNDVPIVACGGLRMRR